MPVYPMLNSETNSLLNTQAFYGLNRGLSIADGEMADMLNMTGDHFPVLASRKARSLKSWPQHEGGGVNTFAGEVAGMMGTDRLIVCHSGKVYVDGEEHRLTVSDEENMKPKHIVSMGAYVCIWPDKKYLNLANLDDYGDMGAKWTAAEGISIGAMMCSKDGTDYDMEAITISDTAPAEPEDKQLWLDTSGENDMLKQYSTMHAEWILIATTYIKIQADGIGEKLKDNDVVHLSGVRAAGDTETETAAETEDTLSFPVADFMLHSAFQTVHYGGTDYRSTTAAKATTIKTVNVTGIPEGAVIKTALVKFKTKYSAWGAAISTMNGTWFAEGETVSLPVTVTANGEVSLKFVFQSKNNATVSGNNYGTLSFSQMSLDVTYEPTADAGVSEADAKQLEELNAANIVYARGKDYIIVAGLLHKALTLDAGLVMELKIPDLDYVCEANNRLWGCSYDAVDGQLTNEIRACALGDFRNWYRFMGVSTDSYVMAVGSDGIFTGAYSLQGVPLFFKEDYLHKVSGTMPSNFTLNTIKCRGVQDGSWRSLAVVNETLLYKARADVMAYDGAMPYSVSEKLGNTKHFEAAAGANRDKYYINMRDENVVWHMYVYDTTKRLWYKENEAKVRFLANVSGELILAGTAGEETKLLAVDGGGDEQFPWSVTMGVFGFAYEQQKYLSRFNIRAQMSAGATMKMEIMYDSNGEWVEAGTARCPVLKTVLLPIIPRRCDHCQVRLSGTGAVKIYSIARVFRQGGDG